MLLVQGSREMNRRRWKRKTTAEILEAARRAQSRAKRYAADAHELVGLAIERWDLERTTMATRIAALMGPTLPGIEGEPSEEEGREAFKDVLDKLGRNVP